jgi:hypothetical protein
MRERARARGRAGKSLTLALITQALVSVAQALVKGGRLACHAARRLQYPLDVQTIYV